MENNINQNYKYLLISPCRNEEKYLSKTIDSVANQSVLPKKWIIVDDGSTDDTPNLLKAYAKKYDFIQIVTKKDRGQRKVGAGVIETFYFGMEHVDINDFDYLCKLDLDLILPEHYFESVVKQMEKNPRYGTYSGKAYYIDKTNGKLISEGCGDESSIGAVKFYRVACFKQIGGFVQNVMWDGIDSHRCRYLGWISKSEDLDEIRFIHLRPMGSSQKNILVGRSRHGRGQYFMGTKLIYLLATVAYRLKNRPYIIGSLAMLYGYLNSWFKRESQFPDKELIKFINQFQWQCLIMGKNKTTEIFNIEREKFWNPNASNQFIDE